MDVATVVDNVLAFILKEVMKLLLQRVPQSDAQAQPSWTAVGEDGSSPLKLLFKPKVSGELVYVALH